MNRLDLQQLAEDRIADVEALLDSGRWSAAYYLAGYVVECALKACIAKQTNLHDFPDKDRAYRAYTHGLFDLAKLAKIDHDLHESQREANPGLYSNWTVGKDWSEHARYEQRSEEKARDLYLAITDVEGGVFPWIKKYW